jgi:hypothetical protein
VAKLEFEIVSRKLKTVIIDTDGHKQTVVMPDSEAKPEGEMIREALEFQRLMKIAEGVYTPEYIQEMAQSRDLNLEESAIEISALMALQGLLEDYLTKAADDAEERDFLKPILGEVNEWETNVQALVPELCKQNIEPVFDTGFSKLPDLKTDILTFIMRHIYVWSAGDALRALGGKDVTRDAFESAYKQILSEQDRLYDWLANALSNYCSEWARSILDEAEKLNLNLQGLRRLIGLEPADDLEPGSESELAALTNVMTRYPESFLSPIDRLSNKAFNGELPEKKMVPLAMERKGSKKQITTLVCIDFEELDNAVQIKGKKELTAYDRMVHDAITTLYVDGGNEYITPQMIYQTMTGKPNAYLNPKQAEEISESLTKCMYTKVTINADEEAKAYGFDTFRYEGSLISGERVTATLNGNVLECLHIFREPVLYEYANKKNQIGRFDIKLLDSPINKNKEILTLQGYLSRRILSMKGSSNLSKTIVYDTVYKHLKVEAASAGALRVKKGKVRQQVKTILDYWKAEGFISGYVENTQKQEKYSVTVEI